MPFLTSSPDIDESVKPGETFNELVSRLSEEKARRIAQEFPDALIIGSDQVAECDDQILTKPGSRENAVKQLSFMSGKKLVFHTGLCVFNAKTNNLEKDIITYSVKFRDLSEIDIHHYLDKEEPYNCAGSFKSEQLGISLVEKMQGDDPTALIGLPLIRLCQMLRNQGVTLP